MPGQDVDVSVAWLELKLGQSFAFPCLLQACALKKLYLVSCMSSTFVAAVQ